MSACSIFTSFSAFRFNLNLNKSYTASQICDESHGDALDIRAVSHSLPVIVSDALSVNKGDTKLQFIDLIFTVNSVVIFFVFNFNYSFSFTLTTFFKQ